MENLELHQLIPILSIPIYLLILIFWNKTVEKFGRAKIFFFHALLSLILYFFYRSLGYMENDMYWLKIFLSLSKIFFYLTWIFFIIFLFLFVTKFNKKAAK